MNNMKIILSVLMFLNLFSGSDDEQFETHQKAFNHIDKGLFLDNLSQYVDSSFTFAATGDILIHDYLYEDVRTENATISNRVLKTLRRIFSSRIWSL